MSVSPSPPDSVLSRLNRQGEATTIYKQPLILRQTLINLPKLREMRVRPVTGRRSRERWAGETVVVCAAGPGLEDSLEWLRDAWQDVGRIVAVNTACGALAAVGVTPDTVVTIESLDVSAQLPPGAEVVCSLSSHPNVFDRADYFLLAGGPHLRQLASHLGIRTAEYGPAALTAAVATCLEFGAAKVVLLGADLSYGRDQTRGYARGTPWEEVRVGLRADGGVDVESPPERHALHERHGTPTLATNRGAPIDLPEAIVGGKHVIDWEHPPRYTTTEMFVQLAWLGRKARVASYRGAEIVNGNRDGAHIPNTRPVDVAAMDLPPMRGGRTIDLDPIPQSRLDDALDDLAAQTERVTAWYDRLVTGPLAPIQPFPFAPFLHCLIAPEVLGLRESGADLELVHLEDRISVTNHIAGGVAREMGVYLQRHRRAS